MGVFFSCSGKKATGQTPNSDSCLLRARIHTGDRVCSFSSTPPSCSLPFHLLLCSVYNTLRGSELITMRGCVCAGVSSRARRNAAVTSSCLLHASERGIEGKKNDTTRFIHPFFPPSFSFIPSGFASHLLKGACFTAMSLGTAQIGRGAKASRGGKSVKLEKFQSAASANIYTCTRAHLHVSTPQISNKGCLAARQLRAQQLGGDKTQKLTCYVTSTDGGETKGFFTATDSGCSQRRIKG